MKNQLICNGQVNLVLRSHSHRRDTRVVTGVLEYRVFATADKGAMDKAQAGRGKKEKLGLRKVPSAICVSELLFSPFLNPFVAVERKDAVIFRLQVTRKKPSEWWPAWQPR